MGRRSNVSSATSSSQNPFLVGLTGASGVVYGVRLVQVLVRLGCRVDVIFSDGAKRVFAEEELAPAELVRDPLALLGLSDAEAKQVRLFPLRDIGALPASGTYPTRGMIVCPASMKTCAAIAHGYSDNLITRAAEVTLKERRTLVLVPRETPLSLIHLRNLTSLAEAGAIIVPAMPGFYHRPKTLDELIDFQVMKILDVLGVDHKIPHAWQPRRDLAPPS